MEIEHSSRSPLRWNGLCGLDDLPPRTNELVSAIRWKGIQERDKEKRRTAARLNHHEHDMKHAHAVDSVKAPELAIHPSHLLQRRANYEHTGAALRGTQLLGAVKGKKKNQVTTHTGTRQRADAPTPPSPPSPPPAPALHTPKSKPAARRATANSRGVTNGGESSGSRVDGR